MDGVGNAGQFVDFGDGVDIGGLQAAHNVIEETEVVGVGRCRADVGTDAGVLLCRGIGGGGCGVVARCAVHVVRLGQDDLVGINDGLDFGRGVGPCPVVGIAQNAV